MQAMRDGARWRRMIHIDRVCRATRTVRDAPKGLVGGELFNLRRHPGKLPDRRDRNGSEDSHSPRRITAGPADPDQRSYPFSFETRRVRRRCGRDRRDVSPHRSLTWNGS